ncbi:DUF6090 family protein [Marixanthomonas spongiae]|uniref:Uncharacterized protein n=1 Tax=Marixanthomonas spongiae TaxID=2174845 RepID=A0A2U0I5X6_9FLAO|nr:DUF6090 family protein [Marixanthomonas spongiae]PVW16492.1 hypothetical protein DDV96_04370 [Marixanthomonas spongiae]
MIKIFRNIRRKHLSNSRFGKYLLYAIGEIILVVIGILIALSINNTNEANKTRAKELHYLENIKTDLMLNNETIDNFIEKRKTQIQSANTVLEYYEGKPLTDLADFSRNCLNVYIWHKFYQNNNTFLELTNSGNLALLSNDSIKNGLLNLDAMYKELKGEEEHYRFDTELLLYEPSFRILDINPVTKKYLYDSSNGQAGEDLELPRKDFETLLKDIKHKNGFVMAVYEFTVMNGQLEGMKEKSNKLIRLIDAELKKD